MDSKLIVKWCALLPMLAIAACASQRPAPVVDRSGRSPVATAPTGKPAVSRVAKDGIYVAQRGDTLQNVALAFGVDPKDLARWNGVPESDVLIPGQTLQVTPPASVATVSPITGSGQAEVRPLPPPGAVRTGRARTVAACRRATSRRASCRCGTAHCAAGSSCARAVACSFSVAAMDLADSRQSHRNLRRSAQQGNRYRGQRRRAGAGRS